MWPGLGRPLDQRPAAVLEDGRGQPRPFSTTALTISLTRTQALRAARRLISEAYRMPSFGRLGAQRQEDNGHYLKLHAVGRVAEYRVL